MHLYTGSFHLQKGREKTDVVKTLPVGFYCQKRDYKFKWLQKSGRTHKLESLWILVKRNQLDQWKGGAVTQLLLVAAMFD
jgi:hypothetical protein